MDKEAAEENKSSEQQPQHDHQQPPEQQPSKENEHEEQPDKIMDNEEPKTPEKVDKIPRDDSFKTCKTFMPSGKTKRQLRMTPARNSILSGGTPFKETTPAMKRFNSRSKKLNKSGSKRFNDTADSNETFIRHEQELLFDRDSLDMAHHKLSSTPLVLPELLPSPPMQNSRRRSTPKVFEVEENPQTKQRPSGANKPKVEEGTKVISPRKEIKSDKRAPEIKTKVPSPIKVVNRNKPATKAPASIVQAKFRRPISPAKSTRRPLSPTGKTFRKPLSPSRFKKPSSPQRAKRPQMQVPSSVKSTASSRYLSQWNNSRLTRTQSFKSTAELEREYFTSLRSRF